MKRTRLQSDDFIALRSLSLLRWRQDETIAWKVNRTWISIPFNDTRALAAVDRLIAVGLAEATLCCLDCRRPAYKLTARGETMSKRINPAKALA